ncbi:MAG: DUF1326 domain-containing protein [Pyrinomonadaceae bacterium]
MNTNELYSGLSQHRPTIRRRLPVTLAAPLLVVCLLALASLLAGFCRQIPIGTRTNAAAAPAEIRPAPGSWVIKGALTESCTCTVPCTCNFGEAPSPHHYCYSLYSYDIRQGKFGDVTLDGLHFGATELKSGRTIFIDERANERQRQALRVIAARVIEHLSVEEAEKKAKVADPNVRYAAIKQEYDARHNHLEVAGVGEFGADYIMGLDKKTPVIVRNNTTWRVYDAIKAKTTVYRVRVGEDIINTKDTNSNQGDFTYTDKTDFGPPEYSHCGSTMHSKLRHGKGEAMCGI